MSPLPLTTWRVMLDFNKIKHDYDGRAIVHFDIVPKIAHLLQRGYMLRDDGKIAPIARTKALEAPWIYTRSRPELNCNFWTVILFETLGVFPPKCLDCWKVVVRPRNVKELVMLLELQENFTERYCKCGVEERSYVNADYGGYFYERSKEDGLDCLDEVRGLVAEHISPGIPVFLKRYCTEFELKFGPSDQVEETLSRGYFINPETGRVPVMPEGDMCALVAAAEQIFDTSYTNTVQPPFVKQHVIRRWFEFAWARGDMTVKEFFGGEDLYTPSVRYERDK